MKKLVAAFVGLSALDIILTLIFIKGGAIELNPIMAKVLMLPLPVIVAYKVGLPLIFGTILVVLDRYSMVARIARPVVILQVVVILMVGVCLFNICGSVSSWSLLS